MQNYSQGPPGYQRPGSTTGFAGQQGAPPPPAYGAPQGYPTTSPPAQSQWAPPAQGQQQGQQQWNQSPHQQQGNWNQPLQQQAPPQQAPGSYNPGQYGAMPGAYNQGQGPAASSQYPTQQQDQPPPPPPKPQGFAAAVQQQAQQPQNQQNWPQQPAYVAQQPQQPHQGPQQSTGYPPQAHQGDFSQGQQAGYSQQQGGFQGQPAPPQPYNQAAPPPASQTPGGSYFPPTQGGRPTSIYGADQAGAYSSPTSAVATQPPNSVLSPNEQHPAYIPPSLTGQGVQSYMPVNTNPMPGVYVPPPPDIPAWQQAQHAPLQGGKKFRYTKPNVDPNFAPQGHQGQVGMQQPMLQGQFGQQSIQAPMQAPQPPQQFSQPPNQFQPQPQMQPQMQQSMQQQAQFGQPLQNQQQQFGQSMQQQGQFQQPQQPQQPQQFGQSTPQGPPAQQPPQQFPQQSQQWQNPPTEQVYSQPSIPAPYSQQQPTQQPVQQQQQQQHQQGWQQGHQHQDSISGQQYPQGQEQGIQAPKPIDGRTGNTPPNFVTNPSPQSQPVSPIQNRHSMSFSSGQHLQNNLGRTGSVSSIAMGALRNQSRFATGSVPPAAPTPPPAPKTNPSAFAASALGTGGPSDWEHFGAGDDEIDDEEIFGAKNGQKDEPAQLDSVELPSHPSPPSTVHEWPTPPPQPAPLNIGIQRRDTYQPTPPPQPGSVPAQQPSQPPQQDFVMDKAIIVADTRASPSPANASQPPPTQQNFVMNDGGWVPPKQSTPQQQQPHQPPPHATTGFVMDDGSGWATQSTPAEPRQQTPVHQHSQQPPPANTGFVMDDGGWGATQQTPTQARGEWGSQPQQQNENHTAELKAKDEAYERLRADNERELARLHNQVDTQKLLFETLQTQTESEKSALNKQIQDLNSKAEQASKDSAAMSREKDITIERLKEDLEGKEDTIEERDATIAQLKQQLEAEKQKEAPKPTPADLIPDINPWYAGSLERYIAMLRSEAEKPNVDDKIKVFTGFLAAESNVRGLDYYSAPPPAPAPAPAPVSEPLPLQTAVEPEVMVFHGGPSSPVKEKPIMQVHTQQEVAVDDDEGYSPGGRPKSLQRKSTLKSNESVLAGQSFVMGGGSDHLPQRPDSGASYRAGNRASVFGLPSEPSSQATTILTPTSSVGGDVNKTPIQSPPDESSQPQYEPYRPPTTTTSGDNSLHRQSVSCVPSSSFPGPTPTSGHNNEEFFFPSEPISNPTTRPTTGMSSDVPVPAPLKLSPAAVTSKKSPIDIVADLLPKQPLPTKPSSRLEEIRKAALALPSDFSYITELAGTWEKTAAQTRAKNDAARRVRQEESEAKTDELFNDNEISYADIGAIEDEFKEKERGLKAQEDRDEYKGFVENVFDKVYDGLQEQIKQLMEAYMLVEALLQDSVTGVSGHDAQSTGADEDMPSTKDCLEVLKELHGLVELRHEKVVAAVADRDRRYKRTEVQPLYAAGNISKMKTVERHFENAERQAVLRARSEKAERVGELVRVTEECVVAAVEGLQSRGDRILDAVRVIEDKVSDPEDLKTLERARESLLDGKKKSKELLTAFNELECELNTAVLEAEIAQAKAEDLGPERVKQLERDLAEGEKKLKEEFARRTGVLERDGEEVGKLFDGLGVKIEMKQLSEQEEREQRMKAALEEAKKRNGAI
ncbi:hypothetical protein BCR34DRAFT_557623 [Clohesyomyces aquaticus]|uniref:Uncharacterized protein n=1 Tax=Clohesyomyces aquaticus TaxID=1231657 RepID=A0A1Y2A1N5_9PLEO|nr:hypothetical protein BCR34DRAFT_557623 [Clohesyomyces aquaticus]